MLSRRNFVKTAAAAGAGLAALSALPVPAGAVPTAKPAKWTYEADVIIIGGGGAGLAAACEAVDKKLSVYVLEKEPILGGSTIICGGQMSFAGTPEQKERNINDSIELYTKDMLEVGEHMNNPELIKAFMDLNMDTYHWLKGMGIAIGEPRAASGMSVPRGHQVSPAQLITVMHKYVTDRGGKVLTNCAAQRLTYDGKKICGITAKLRGKDVSFGAKKGVILAAGGYSRNPDLLGQYTPAMRRAQVVAGMGCTGDGIKMAQAYGADFIDSPYVKATFGVILKPNVWSQDRMSYYYSGAAVLNKRGKRIVNESISYKLIGDAALAQPEGYAFQVFDSAVRAATYEKNKVSPEAARKFEERPGIVFKADSIKEVAKLAGIDPDAAEETIKNYNRFVEKGTDPEFGRQYLSGKYGKPLKIEKPPFYAMPTTAAVIATYCGVRITPKTQVVDVFGQLIPGLYAAGEMTGGFHGSAYMTGTAFAKAVVFGRIAARNAGA